MEIINNSFIIGEMEDPKLLHNKINKDQDDETLMEACKEFEALFLSMMFKEMKKTVPEGDLVEKGLGTRIFEDLYVEEISNEVAKQDAGLGIADMMYQQFKKGYVSW
ncbi:rod-binding protein [Clostridium sp. Cult3]|uniref:rod-binding protein n=1 Tax=Clostridium sp. Cult3 TaxID=2079004 RepID=UPI001F169F2A|nr:hypothetical protein [Clostridium sp. Cult3]